MKQRRPFPSSRRALILLAAAMAVLISPIQAALTDYLVGYWPLNETGGTIFGNMVTGGSNGVLNGDSFFTPALMFNGVDLDGDGDSLSITPDLNLVPGPSGFSISVWLSSDGLPRDYDLLFQKLGRGGTSGNGWQDGYGLYFRPSGDGVRAFWYIGDYTGSGGTALSQELTDFNVWHHFVCTYDGVDLIQIYVDGQAGASHADDGNDFASGLMSNGEIVIGARGSINNWFIDGLVYDSRDWLH